jgi:hypothetical protein
VIILILAVLFYVWHHLRRGVEHDAQAPVAE